MRECGTCTMCCEILNVPDVTPAHEQCRHARVGGCGVYKDRPDPCRTFSCGWLTGHVPEDLKPDKVRAVIHPGGNYLRGSDGKPILSVMVSPHKHRPDGWRKGPLWKYIRAQTAAVVVDDPNRPGGWLVVNGEITRLPYVEPGMST